VTFYVRLRRSRSRRDSEERAEKSVVLLFSFRVVSIRLKVSGKRKTEIGCFGRSLRVGEEDRVGLL
jgi:hypothetical protein